MVACFAGDLDVDGGSFGCGGVAVAVRHGAQEGVEDQREEVWGVERRPVGCVADLLLVVPLLGVLAGDVEPDGCGIGACPVYGVSESEGVEAGEVGCELRAGEGEEIAEKVWADSSGGADPVGVVAVDEGDEVLVAVDGAVGGRAMLVAATGEVAEVSAEEMQGDVFDGPEGRGGWLLPVVG